MDFYCCSQNHLCVRNQILCPDQAMSMNFGEEEHGDKVSFLLYHIKGPYYQNDLTHVILPLITWLMWFDKFISWKVPPFCPLSKDVTTVLFKLRELCSTSYEVVQFQPQFFKFLYGIVVIPLFIYSLIHPFIHLLFFQFILLQIVVQIQDIYFTICKIVHYSFFFCSNLFNFAHWELFTTILCDTP